MKNQLNLISHPLLRHKLAHLRDKTTRAADFRSLLTEISNILAYEAMRDWKDFFVEKIETPLKKTEVSKINNPPVIVSILRAGNGMLDGVLSMIPIASIGFIGIYRDSFIQSTVEYYFKLPKDIAGKTIFLCDPLISSGDTMMAALERLMSYHVGPINILCVLMSRLALQRIQKTYPQVKVYALNVEEEISESGYLIPGLGDAGDRLYQTK